MSSIRLQASDVVRRINDRIRIAPAQLFAATDCHWLVLVDDALLSLATGRQYRLANALETLADDACVADLVKGAQELASGDARPVGLLLPHCQFVYSHYSVQLGGEYLANRDLVLSAIALQKDLLLPAMEQEFALAAGAGQSAGVAFWLPQDVLRKLEGAFAAAGLELVALLPRALAVAPSDPERKRYVVADEDASSCALVEIDGRVATRMLSALKQEFENEDLANAWREQAAPLLENAPVHVPGAEGWRKLDGARPISDYAFYTQEFLQHVENKNQARKAWAVGVVALAAAFVLALPLVYQWVDVYRLESARNAARQESRVAASYQNKILGMEAEWGVIYEYPEVDLSRVLTTLNSMIRNSLTSFTFDKSTIEIQGYVSDPEQLMRALVAQPMFESIEQTRSVSATNSGADRFGLRMKLADAQYGQYANKYTFK